MKRYEPRENEMIDDAGARPTARRVCIMNGPMVMEAPHTSEGRRRFVIVAGTVVLEGEDPVPAHADPAPEAPEELPPLHRHTPLESYREAFVGFARRR